MKLYNSVFGALLLLLSDAIVAANINSRSRKHEIDNLLIERMRRASNRKREREMEQVTIRVAVLLPEEGDYLFTRRMVQPGIEYAVKKLHNTPGMLPDGYDLKLSYYDSKCSQYAAVSAVDAYYGESGIGDEKGQGRGARCNKTTDNFVMIGPVCNTATAIVATFATKWNVPLITAGAPAGWMTPYMQYPTLTRVTSTHMDLAFFLRNIFKIIGYGVKVPVTLIYEDFHDGITTDRECQYMMQAVYSAFTSEGEDMWLEGPYTIGSNEFDEDAWVQTLRYTKVMLMCGHPDIIRRLMLAGHRNGVTDPQENLWMVIDMHNGSHYSNKGWQRGDRFDEEAKLAYRSLQVVSLHVNKSREFQEFSSEINSVYRANKLEKEGDDLINEYVEGFHDALMLYAHALRAQVAEGGNISNGTEISNHMRNVIVEGIGSPIKMDRHGDRHGDFSILAMTNYTTGTFESVYDLLGSVYQIINREIPKLNLTIESGHKPRDNYQAVVIPNGKQQLFDSFIRMVRICKSGEEIFNPPLNKQSRTKWQQDLKRGYKNMIDNFKRGHDEGSSRELQAAILGTFGGIIICCVLMVGPICYQRKKRGVRTCTSENGLMAGPFFNTAEDMCQQMQLRDEGSVTTCNTTLDDDQKL